VVDDSSSIVLPDEVTYTGVNALTVDLSSYGSITGTWRVTILDSGAVAVGSVSDTAYSAAWDGVTDVAPSKNAVYDKIETLPRVIPGSIVIWPTETVPTGYLECNGASLLRTDYASLYSVIGTIYGAADAAHFNIPDLRGRILRAWDHGHGDDPDSAARTKVAATGATMTAGDHVGTEQAEGIKAHSHTSGRDNTLHAALGAITGFKESGDAGMTGVTGGNETRPVNTYMMFIIKT